MSAFGGKADIRPRKLSISPRSLRRRAQRATRWRYGTNLSRHGPSARRVLFAPVHQAYGNGSYWSRTFLAAVMPVASAAAHSDATLRENRPETLRGSS